MNNVSDLDYCYTGQKGMAQEARRYKEVKEGRSKGGRKEKKDFCQLADCLLTKKNELEE